MQWLPNAPERFAVSAERSAAILHSIEGLDPHKPAFERDRCYLWRLWHAITLSRTGQVFVRTPGGRGPCTESLRSLLAYHYLGAMETPRASSRDLCPCGQGRTYGECCFPVVTMDCGSPLCVNPFHMRVGRASAVPIEHGDVPVLSACPSCLVCGWQPLEFYATALIRGYHETACANPLRLDAAGQAVLQDWRREGIQNQVGRSVAAGAFDDSRHARLYASLIKGPNG